MIIYKGINDFPSSVKHRKMLEIKAASDVCISCLSRFIIGLIGFEQFGKDWFEILVKKGSPFPV